MHLHKKYKITYRLRILIIADKDEEYNSDIYFTYDIIMSAASC